MNDYPEVAAFLAERGFSAPDHIFDYRLFEPKHAKAMGKSVPLEKYYCLSAERNPANYALINAGMTIEVAYVGSTIQPRMRLNAHRRPKALWPRWQAAHQDDFHPVVAIWLAGPRIDIDLIEQQMIDGLNPVYNKRRRPLCYCSFRGDTKTWGKIERQRVRDAAVNAHQAHQDAQQRVLGRSVVSEDLEESRGGVEATKPTVSGRRS